MFILYFDGAFHEYYHAAVYNGWTAYDKFRPGEGFWLVPGTDPEDDAYGHDYQDDAEDENQGDENDETLEYMCDLLEAHEIEPSEFRRQLLSVGYASETISSAIADHPADPRGPFFSTQWEREDYERQQRGEPERGPSLPPSHSETP